MNTKHYKGSACTRCAETLRYKSSGGCVGCAQAQASAYKHKNRSKINAQQRARKEPAAERKRYRAYYYSNLSAERARARAYAARNRTRVNAQTAQSKRNNPHARAAHEATRRARLVGAQGHHTAQERTAVLAVGRCLKCSSTEQLSVDHVVPLAVGGSNSASNLQCLCKSCNSSKGVTAVDYRR